MNYRNLYAVMLSDLVIVKVENCIKRIKNIITEC